jgi:hypothetical protein
MPSNLMNGRGLAEAALAILAITGLLLSGSSSVAAANVQTSFFDRLQSLCGARFEGRSTFPEDPGDAFRGKTLVAVIERCDDGELRIPFRVGDDRSRTWILKKIEGGLELKHDHRHEDGTPDEVTMYGGTTTSDGTEHSQSFPADAHTRALIPEAATNVWSLTLSADGSALTYDLERHGKPRFEAKLHRASER